MQTIIALSGRKASGKNTVSAFIANYYAYRQVYPGTNFIYDAGKEFLKSDFIYSYVRGAVGFYSFADTLKDFCIETLGLDLNQCYGSDEQKNSPTKYKWEDVNDEFLRWKFGDKEWFIKTDGVMTNPLDFHPLRDKKPTNIEDRNSFNLALNRLWKPNLKTGFMSAREIMQLFGTELIRSTFGNVWASSTMRKIKEENKPLALVSDLRFVSETSSMQENGGYIIRLTRTPFGQKDTHPSEAELDGFDWSLKGCYVLDNQSMSEDEQNKALLPILKEIGI